MGKVPNSSSSRKLKGGAEVPLEPEAKIATDAHLGVTSSNTHILWNWPPTSLHTPTPELMPVPRNFQ